MWKMAYYFFYDKTNSPIVYYSSVVVNITALMWSIIVKEYKPLEEHIFEISARSMAGSMFGEL